MPTGCVPLAMAQIMYYWSYPNSYNWNSMVKNPSIQSTNYLNNPGGYTESARLINDIGITTIMSLTGFPASFANYGTLQTGADDAYCTSVFSHFGYSSANRTISIANQVLSGPVNGTSYSGLLTNELQSYRPCMIAGYPDESSGLGVGILPIPQGSGHEWVCDGSNVSTYYYGYTNTYQTYSGQIITNTTYTTSVDVSLLHMNWGWGFPTPLNGQGGPNNDGWYNCNVDYTTSPNNNGNFQYFQTIIYNIHH